MKRMLKEREVDVEQVKARVRGNWLKVLPMIAVELRQACESVGRHVPCPNIAHKNSKDGFRMFADANETGGGICNTCGSFPDGFSVLMWMEKMTFIQAIAAVSDYLDTLSVPLKSNAIVSCTETQDPEEIQINRDAEKNIKNTIECAVRGDQRVREYLKHRGLPEELADNLLLNKNCYYNAEAEKPRFFDAIIAPVQNVEGRVVSALRIYLSKNGPGKAEVPYPKKLMTSLHKDAMRGSAIRLGEAAETMCVAEGLETALAVQVATGMPVWVSSSTMMPNMQFPSLVKKVLIWADNDKNGAGKKAAESLEKNLGKQGVAAKILYPAKAGDDWLDEYNKNGVESLRRAINEEQTLQHEDELEKPYKLPLVREKEPPIPFPVNALGDELEKIVAALVDTVQAPMPLCAQSLLAALTISVQAFADIKIDGRTGPVSIFFLSIAQSGERKSAVDNIVLQPVREHEADKRGELEKDLHLYNSTIAVYDKQRNEAIKIGTPECARKALEKLGPPPKKPPQPNMLIDDPTIEGLLSFLSVGQPSAGIFSDEGGRVVGGHGMSPENQLKTVTTYSQLWDGKQISSIRKSSGATFISGVRLSLHLMLQPEIADNLLSNAELKAQGFLSRTLICEPESTIGERVYKEPNPESTEALKEYSQRIKEILKREFPFKSGSIRELDPRQLPLSAAAKKIYINFYNIVEREQKEKGKYQSIRGFASKAAEHALRLAGVLSLFDDIDAPEISESKMHGAVALMDFYLHESFRQIDTDGGGEELILARALLKWLQEHGGCHNLVEIYQNGPTKIRTAQKAREILEILSEHGWVRYVGEKVLNEKNCREVWELV